MKFKPYQKEGIFNISVDNYSQSCSIEEIEEWLQEVKNGSTRTLYLDKRKTARTKGHKKDTLSRVTEHEKEMYQKLRGLFDDDTIDGFGQKLSSTVARLWGSMIDEVVVWG